MTQLEQLTELWPTLPADVRAALLVLATSATPGAAPTVPAPALKPIDREILRQLAPGALVMAIDVADAVGRGLSGLYRRLQQLERAGLVRRPLGDRSGWAITPKGAAMLEGPR